ncbi:MAG TPA: type I phosphomannose isomerase catalytic subunit, partial [Armatimonadota bacterium]|nr:type I phosphomannose isomerase catalytic subunit [Armatimonadota bacterium]
MPHFPLKCEPLLVPKIWGGRRLQAVLGKRLPSRERIGEAWEVADIPEGLSRVADANGHAGTLRGLMEDHAEAVAPGNVNDRFPLLIKFLDASQNLSIQVHPGRRACEQLGPEAQSKEECWVVVHADPGASVLHGLRPGVGKIEIANAAGTASLPDLVRKVPIAPGDVLDVPAGTAHAISAGCVLMEVQQPSDTTYRLYDFDRQAQQDNDRPLHIEQALVALRTGNQGEPKIAVP